ncbi:MAG TPA: biopolymer transporter ExbD [Pirellulaceae bacterium]|nr:biopolymer transporter ExbD [Pirellulaceae bacterium]HMO90751.1 biopolymer transporter ExbD [Pirellulaceae bacterium]HMP68002.1 biopolymer transporter ExbD [Pirellulaceae bacterium]
MKRPNLFLSRENDLDTMMTPMIDVVFLLLIFFIWTTSMAIVEYVLPSRVSAQQGSQASNLSEPLPEMDFQEIVIKIGWDGSKPRWDINGVRFGALDQVDQQLRAIGQIKLDSPVIVHPEPIVPVGYVIEVFDITKLVGFEQVSFAVEQAPQG